MGNFPKSLLTINDLKFHELWITEYCKLALREEIGKRSQELIWQTCEEVEIYNEKAYIALNHVQQLISVQPQFAINEVVQRIK